MKLKMEMDEMNLLVPMTELEYAAYIKDKIARYALTLQENTFELTIESPSMRALINH